METLKPNQKAVIEEALRRDLKGGGLALPLGFGKTRTSICLGLTYNCGPILVVASKTLGITWLSEIPKAFGEDFEFEYLHSDHIKNIETWEPKPNTKLVITTPEVLSAVYKSQGFADTFLKYNIPEQFGPTILEYMTPKSPMFRSYRSGPAHVYCITWGCLIIDEIQNNNNILRDKCRSIACISAKYRWGLSGTMFDEPKPERFLGYFTMLHIDGPRTLPDVTEHMKTVFKGFRHYIIHRTDNVEFIKKPKYTEQIVAHNLSDIELKIFDISREVLSDLNNEVKKLKALGDTDGVRTFSAYLLAMITYVRQFLICPIIPISGIYCDIADFTSRSNLSSRLSTKFRELDLESWLNSMEALHSSRFKSIMEKIECHPDERIIVFSCFRTTVSLFQHNIDQIGVRKTFTISAGMSVPKREQVIRKFEEYPNGILLLPYSIGAEGLNLQCASVVMLMDLWWNSAKIQQAIGRVFRPGQEALEIFVYIFVSNTGMENEIIKKNIIKRDILNELHNGSCQKKVPKMTVRQIIKVIECSENENLIKSFR